jgi:hypothetical protein
MPNIVMLSVVFYFIVMLNGIMLNVTLLSVIILNVVAPSSGLYYKNILTIVSDDRK